jgi:4-hydroxy-2-oxoheptanedioate aldolase
MVLKVTPSRVLRKMRAGQPAFCFKINTDDPRVAEIAAMSGIDCVWLDREHCPNDLGAIEHQIRACLLHGADPMVRVPRGSYSELIWPLEMNASGIMVPHVMSAADAKQIAWQTRFHPIGRRPLDGGNADGGYCGITIAEYVRQSNEQKFIIAQIEDPEPLEELDGIASVAGIDMILFGPGDFSHAIGFAGETDHPKVLEARKRVLDACKRHNKFAGTVGSVNNAAELTKMGFDFLNIGADVVGLMTYFGQIIDKLGGAVPGAGERLSGPYK